MSIEHYRTIEAREALDKIGWPEWPGIRADQGNEKLAWGEPFFKIINQQGEQRELPDHIVLCLIRDCARGYIERTREQMPCKSNQRFDTTRNKWIKCQRWSLPFGQGGLVWFDDYDEALLVALRRSSLQGQPKRLWYSP